ncbi:MAG: type II toxin-antitoxin system RelB/DinJ family antitoxin [Clostridia bacterium]|nr:type II toxin-antitoxin system RelB/DinJ family antitoxin [Clostridia bacterium]
MATTNLNVRVDETLKKNAEELLSDLGMNMSTAINVFLRQVVRVHGIPFEIKSEIPNAETMAALEDVKNKRNLHGPFSSVEELMEDLNAAD